jgi:hypothetical protein
MGRLRGKRVQKLKFTFVCLVFFAATTAAARFHIIPYHIIHRERKNETSKKKVALSSSQSRLLLHIKQVGNIDRYI